MAKSDRYLKERIKRVAFSVLVQQSTSKSARELRLRCDVIRDGRRPREASIKLWEKGIVCPDWRALAE
jgi:hypothetical protein